ncbi:hypothetical protein REPUB_Repub01dG0230400 [Reevesia pubescens]
MTSHEDDLDLLLSLQDRVLETPPASPSNPHSHSQSPGYLSDDGSPRQRGKPDLSAFKNVVEDCLDYEPKPVERPANSKPKSSNDLQVEKFSGLRLRKQLVSPAELSERLSDIRFGRQLAIKYVVVLLVIFWLFIGICWWRTLYGCWATIGVLTEKGNPKTSSIGQSYSIWNIGCLDENTVSLFLFGDAYQQNCKEQAGMVFALFSCTVRTDTKVSACHMLIAYVGHQGAYCQYHKSKASERYSTMRTELGRNKLEKAHEASQTTVGGSTQKSINKWRTNRHSQEIRFLNAVTGEMNSKSADEASKRSGQQMTGSEKRKMSTVKQDTSLQRNKQLDSKRRKIEQGQTLEDNWTRRWKTD